MNFTRKTFLVSALLFGLIAPAVAKAQIGFADDQPDRLRLWNDDFFEIAIRKSDGRVLNIIDKTTGQQVTPGNLFGPWVMRFSNNTWLDGVNFSPANANRLFSYQWNAQTSILTLNYVATGSQQCQITLTIVPTTGPEIDTTLTLNNQSGMSVELLAYPVHFSFQRSELETIYMPHMEGMRLLPTFFTDHDFGSRYPGQMFADFSFAQLTSGHCGVYMIHDAQDPIKPGFWHLFRDNASGGVNKIHHDYDLALASGQSWTSPTTVFSIGSSLEHAMDDYWTRSGYDNMPTLEDKLGPDLLRKLSRAVLLKRDFLQGTWTFSTFQSFLPNLPAENLLHFVAFWPVGFDENYPDYLPPHPSLGSQSALANLVSTARNAGHLVMPYTNPTWWDDQGPTLSTLGNGIAVRDRNGNPIYEFYGTHGGYVVSPHAPEVIARQDQTRIEFSQTIPCDFLFEDQVGARRFPTYGAHPACPNPIEYTQGLVDVAERSASYLPIMSEGGYDRLSNYESGYCLSQTIGWDPWPESTVSPYPMLQLWAHENLYLNAHNLANASMAKDLPLLTYYMSMGYGLSYDLLNYDATWLRVLDCFQKQLVAPIVGKGMTSFDYLAANGQSQTTFSDGTILVANRTGSPLFNSGSVIAPNGFLSMKDGKVRGGVLSVLYGQPLAGGTPHYLAIDEKEYRITICQPLGADGNIALPRPQDWTDESKIFAHAESESGSIFNQSVNITPTFVSVNYLGNISGQTTKSFTITYCRAADADCDGDVDSEDFSSFERCLTGPELPVDPSPPATVQSCIDQFDADGDQDVDLADLAEFQTVFDGSS